MILRGSIRSQTLIDTDGFRRREIKVQQQGRYPRPGDEVILIDVDGDMYSTNFIKGGDTGYTLLSSGNNIKNWFLKWYTPNRIVEDSVFLEQIAEENNVKKRFIIYTLNQWRSRH